MKVKLIEKKTGIERHAEIQNITKKEQPLKKDGWNLSWRSLFKVEGSEIFKISLEESPKDIQGLLMLTMFNDEMLFMNNIEIAPQNVGKNKKYENTAGILLAFACKESFEKGKGSYVGFLSFDNKTELIELYHSKYGGTVAMGNKMFFDPEAGKTLMRKYLEIKK